MSGFELMITVLDDEKIQARTQNGAEINGKVKQDRLLHDTIDMFEDWLSQSRITRRQEFEVLGRLLYEVLFSGEIGVFFEGRLFEARSAHERLVVRLSFTEAAAKLANLPWEYLYYKNGEFFLSTRVDLVLSRYVQLGEGRQLIEPVEGPLSILIVISDLEDQDRASVSANEVMKVIQGLANDYRVKFDLLDKPTVDNFLAKLEETKPHVLHFIGHGRYNKAQGEAKIAMLEADEKSIRWVNDDDFAEYFTRVTVTAIPRLVLLHLCASETNGSATKINYDNFTANFAQLAPQLLRANIPAVVAMQHPIKDEAAVAFSRAFYRELAKGNSIDAAVQEGRWRITTGISKAYDDRVFGAPVLYMRSHGGIIRPAEQASSTKPKPIAEELAPKPQKVSRIASDFSTNPAAKLTEDVTSQPTVNPPAKPDTMSVVESRQAVSGVNIDPIKPDPDRVSRFHSVSTIISAGRKKMAEMPDLTAEQQGQISQKLSIIRGQLFDQVNREDMKSVLLNYLTPQDSNLRDIVWSMIDALE